MNSQIHKVGLVGFLTLLVSTMVVAFLAYLEAGLTSKITVVFFGIGLLVSAVAWLQMRLEFREESERLEFEDLTRRSKQSSLFDADDSDILNVRQARRQFEKYFVPGFTLFLVALEMSLSIWLWNVYKSPLVSPPAKASIFIALFAVSGVAVFLVGNYISNFARYQGSRLLKPVANHVLLGAYLMGITAAAYAGYEMKIPAIDYWINRVLSVFLGLLAVENLVTLILEVYRPKTLTGEVRVIYQSRLIELLSRPESFFTQAAQALDYQFGFQVSHTWIYRFFRKIIGWVVLAQVVLLLASTCVVIIDPTEEALIERLGKPLEAENGVLKPGLHFKMPWPVDKVHRHKTEQVQSFYVGYRPVDDNEVETPAVLWTTAHTTKIGEKPIEMMVADKRAGEDFDASLNQREVPPVNLMVVSIPVQYQVTELKNWVYEHQNASQLLESIAYQETTRYMVNADFFDVLSAGLGNASQALQERIQKRADELKLGVRILFVGLQDVHPSIKAAQKFQDVVGATIQREATRMEAEAYGLRQIPSARAQAAQILDDAQSRKESSVLMARGISEQFLNQIKSYEASNLVYTNRAYLKTLSEVASKARVYLIGTENKSEIYQLNLEDKLRPDLGDVVIDE